MSEKDLHQRNLNALRSVSAPVSNTLGYVTAGVGDVISGKVISKKIEMQTPVQDVTSQEALDAYKEYNTRVNKEANKIGFYSGFFNSLSGSLFIGAFAGIGFALTGIVGPVAAGVILVTSAITVGLVGLAAKQHITETITPKSMEVADFQIKREAALIAKEIKAALNEEMGAEKDAPQAETQEKAHTDTKWTEFVESRTTNEQGPTLH